MTVPLGYLKKLRFTSDKTASRNKKTHVSALW